MLSVKQELEIESKIHVELKELQDTFYLTNLVTMETNKTHKQLEPSGSIFVDNINPSDANKADGHRAQSTVCQRPKNSAVQFTRRRVPHESNRHNHNQLLRSDQVKRQPDATQRQHAPADHIRDRAHSLWPLRFLDHRGGLPVHLQEELEQQQNLVFVSAFY